MHPAPADWLCCGRFAIRVGWLLRSSFRAWLGVVRMVARGRVRQQRWIRYDFDLTGRLPAVPPDVRLTRVTDELYPTLCEHPESAESQLRSGLRFWEQGLRRAYVWMGEDGEGPLCIQWLLTEADRSRLRRMGDWAGMYPPLPRDWGQVENLFAFASARKQGVASRFEDALYHEARRLGLTRLVIHVHEPNTAARAWVDRTGWRRCGTITRYHVELPGLRGRSVYLHRREKGAERARHATLADVTQPTARPLQATPH